VAISPDEAAEVAHAAGLTLSDARALTVLAQDVNHARRLAARFADPAPVTHQDLEVRSA
jgi:hypothetical protein